MGEPLVIGHRGAPGYRPEHTRSSYRLALEIGVDAVEPDLVPTKDGVLVVRHGSEIGISTDVATRLEFADRRVTKVIDGVELTGWFTEDFTWAELSTLNCRERVPHLRSENRLFNDIEPILTFDDLLDMLEKHNSTAARPVGLVVEVKHPTYFTLLGFDMACMTRRALKGRPWGGAGYPLWIECFELPALRHLREHNVIADLVYLIEASGAAPNDVARWGPQAPSYSEALTEEGLADLSEVVSGLSPAWQRLISTAGENPGRSKGLVEAAHESGLSVFTWTLRPENQFLADPWKNGMSPARWGNWRAQFEAILATGVDGVFLDHPDLVFTEDLTFD